MHEKDINYYNIQKKMCKFVRLNMDFSSMGVHVKRGSL